MSLTSPKISVLITAFNEECYLSLALDSLLAQTFDDFEIILINDGSTDQTQTIIEHYCQKDSRVVACHLHKNGGRVAGLNKAAELATGKYYAIMDSDDYSCTTRLDKQYAFLEKNPSLGMTASFFNQIDSRGVIIKTVDKLPENQEILKEILYQDNPICHGTVMVRASVFHQLGGYRPAFCSTEDYDFYLRLLDISAIGIVPEVLYHYRVHGNSLSSKRLLQLQMKHLAQVLSVERRSPMVENGTGLPRCGQDSLQAQPCLADQHDYVQQFLRSDVHARRGYYSQSLVEMGKKYYRLKQFQAASVLLKQSLTLNPFNFKAFRYQLACQLKRRRFFV
ncbi:MAG: glycosyltransferase [Cyanobacteria bacterium P01_H01_bin.74]